MMVTVEFKDEPFQPVGCIIVEGIYATTAMHSSENPDKCTWNRPESIESTAKHKH